jgi:phospholipid transport system substrate-binding protein
MPMNLISFRTLALASAAIVCLVAISAQAAPPAASSATAEVSSHDAAKGKSQIQTGAENFVGSMAKRALDFLGNGQQTPAQKTESFRRLLEDNYDMDTIGRFTLGRYWKIATPQQRDEYQKLFRKRVVEMYSRRFSDYKGQKFEVKGSRPDGDSDIIVNSSILPTDGSPEVMVEWRVRYKDDRYRVVDVIVEGVSMSVTQRSDFASVIQQGGGDVQVLLDHLKQNI